MNNSQNVYQERLDLIKRTINLEPVERVPFIYMGMAFTPRYVGRTVGEMCADHDLPHRLMLEAAEKLGGVDGFNMPMGGRITPLLSACWMSRLAVPGVDIDDNTLWQVLEKEVLLVEDYDTILREGWKPFVYSYLPRVVNPEEVMDVFGWLAENGERIVKDSADHGYVVICDVPQHVMPPVSPPFEALCGGRSMGKFFKDLVRMPDKVEEVMQVILQDQLEDIKKAPQASCEINGVWLGGWRAASGMISPRIWNRFVWPYMEKLANALIEKGYKPVLHWDQDWTRDLERLNDLPKGKCILNPDGMTDMKRFKEVAADNMAMMGDVPSALLTTGTPEDVTRYVHKLVELFEGRGLLLSPGCDAPIDARPENVEAMVAAVQRLN